MSTTFLDFVYYNGLMSWKTQFTKHVENLHWLLCHQTRLDCSELVHDTLVFSFNKQQDTFSECDLQDWFAERYQFDNNAVFECKFLVGCRTKESIFQIVKRYCTIAYKVNKFTKIAVKQRYQIHTPSCFFSLLNPTQYLSKDTLTLDHNQVIRLLFGAWQNRMDGVLINSHFDKIKHYLEKYHSPNGCISPTMNQNVEASKSFLICLNMYVVWIGLSVCQGCCWEMIVNRGINMIAQTTSEKNQLYRIALGLYNRLTFRIHVEEMTEHMVCYRNNVEKGLPINFLNFSLYLYNWLSGMRQSLTTREEMFKMVKAAEYVANHIDHNIALSIYFFNGVKQFFLMRVWLFMYLLSVACFQCFYGSNERGKLFSICHTMKRCLRNTVKWRHHLPYFEEYKHLDNEYDELKKCKQFEEIWQHCMIGKIQVEMFVDTNQLYGHGEHWYFEQFLIELYEQLIEHRPWTHLSWVITYTSYLQYGNVPRWCANDSNNRHNNDPFVVFDPYQFKIDKNTWFCSSECKKKNILTFENFNQS